jgi:hypothetical protein
MEMFHLVKSTSDNSTLSALLISTCRFCENFCALIMPNNVSTQLSSAASFDNGAEVGVNFGALVVGVVRRSQGTHRSDRNIIEPGPHVLLFHGSAIVHQSAVRQAPTHRASLDCWGICPFGTPRGTGAVTAGSELGVPQESLSKTRALYSLTNLHMPNWNNNRVEIHAPQDAVMAWLIP